MAPVPFTLKGIDRTGPIADISDEVLARLNAAYPFAEDADIMARHDDIVPRITR